MKVSIVVPVYNSSDYLRNLFATAMNDAEKHDIEFLVFTHSDNEASLQVIKEMRDINIPIVLFDYRENRGLARTWNEGSLHAFGHGADVCIICNDDIYFSEGDVD